MDDNAAVLDAVHAIETAKTTPSLKVCDNPICKVEFAPTCLPWSCQSYCSDQCRQQASLIRRAVKILAQNPEAQLPELDEYVLRRAKTLLNDVGLGEFHRLLDQL